MGELTGVVIGVTAERRASDFIGALERYGASVVHAPTITIVPLDADPDLRAGTTSLLSAPFDFTAVTTGAGFRGWLSAASDWGMRDRLVSALGSSRIFARGPKAVGALRGEGLREAFSAASESNAELFSALVSAGISGSRVAVQLHGTGLPEYTGLLTDAGASVVEVQPYRWHSPPDPSPVWALLDTVLAGSVDALAFTSAPAASNFLGLARERGRYEDVVTALRAGSPMCVCVGPVTAAPLESVGVRTVQPERQRLGALVKLLVSELSGSKRPLLPPG